MKTVESRMREYGNGSRAVLSFGWAKGNDGNVINVVNRKGRIQYYDGQTEGMYRNEGSTLYSVIKPSSAQLTRVDNLDFSDTARLAVRQDPFRNRG